MATIYSYCRGPSDDSGALCTTNPDASVLATTEVRVDCEQAATRVALAGEFDVARKAVLSEALGKAIAVPSRCVLVDMNGVTFLDSSGIHALLTAQGTARDCGRELHVTRVPPGVQRVMEICEVWATLTDGDAHT